MNWQPGTCSTRGGTTPPSSYLCSAMEKYEAWGAKLKVAHLKSRYSRLIADDHAEAAAPSANLDLGTMLKASEAISSTIELEPLLEILLHILMENAGAQTATLILETEGQSLVADRRAPQDSRLPRRRFPLLPLGSKRDRPVLVLVLDCNIPDSLEMGKSGEKRRHGIQGSMECRFVHEHEHVSRVRSRGVPSRG